MQRFIFILFFVFFSVVLPAQVTFKILLPKEPIVAGESFRVQYIIEGSADIRNFNPPSFSQFRLVNEQEVYRGMIIVHGQPVPSTNTTYTLQALKTGIFKIDNAVAIINGERHESNSGTIRVISRETAQKNSRQNGGDWDNPDFLQPGEDPYQKIKDNLFVKVAVDKHSCFVGQPVVAIFKLYSRLQSRSEIYKNPGLYGFTVQDMVGLDNKETGTETVNGKLFNVHTIRKVQLYPLQAGSFMIDPMEIKNKIAFSRSAIDRKSGPEIVEGVFDDTKKPGLEGDEVFETILKTPAVSVLVKPVPGKNKPVDFDGAMGKFSVEVQLGQNQLAKNQQGYLLVRVTGKGNFNQLSAPIVNWPGGVEGFDPLVTDTLHKEMVPLQGSRTFRYPFIAARAGAYQVPAIQLPFFDPDSNRYKTATSQPVTILISNEERLTAPVTITKRTSIADINRRASLVAGSIVLVLICVVLIYWLRKTKQADGSLPPTITEEQPSVATYLLPAYEQLNDSKVFYSRLYQLVWQWLSNQYHLYGSEMNQQRLWQQLQLNQQPQALIDDLRQLLANCQAGMFTNALLEEEKEKTWETAKRLLEQLQVKKP